MSSPSFKPCVYILSDSTGETASSMVKAALIQFRNKDVNIVRCKNVRTEAQAESVIEEVFNRRALVVHTVVSESLREKIRVFAAEKAVPCVDLIGPLMLEFTSYFGGGEITPEAGLLRSVDDRYFRRIEAIEYTVKHDDGKLLTDLDKADILLVGISRTSKTPLSIFLSHKGWKVVNVPLVLDQTLPAELFEVDQRKVVGLTINPDNLFRIRRKRLEKFGQDPGGDYASMRHIQDEIDYARDIFKKNRRWPVFDITDRALEETAAEIIKIVATRMDLPYHRFL